MDKNEKKFLGGLFAGAGGLFATFGAGWVMMVIGTILANLCLLGGAVAVVVWVLRALGVIS
jgi:hypothetical protein